jgi:hypothetical protein
MKTKIKVEKEVEIKTLSVKAGVRYWEDGTINGEEDTNGNLVPCRNGDCWCPQIDIDNGIILNWKKGVKADIHYKVCDAGSYFLQDEAGNTILSIMQNYVPDMMCPKGEGYGDYIIMDIDENGKIADWDGTNLSEFIDED